MVQSPPGLKRLWSPLLLTSGSCWPHNTVCFECSGIWQPLWRPFLSQVAAAGIAGITGVLQTWQVFCRHCRCSVDIAGVLPDTAGVLQTLQVFCLILDSVYTEVALAKMVANSSSLCQHEDTTKTWVLQYSVLRTECAQLSIFFPEATKQASKQIQPCASHSTVVQKFPEDNHNVHLPANLQDKMKNSHCLPQIHRQFWI